MGGAGCLTLFCVFQLPTCEGQRKRNRANSKGYELKIEYCPLLLLINGSYEINSDSRVFR